METTYVINLAECKKRMTAVDKNLNEYGIKYLRWEATKGSALSSDELREKTSYMCRNFLCSKGVIGCYLSHLRLWQHIASTYGCDPKKWFLIFEDDAKINGSFIENLKGVFDDLSHWEEARLFYRYPELIHLACNTFCNIGKKVTPHISTSYFVTTTRAYLISAAGAFKLARKIDTVKYHIDFYLSLHHLLNDTVALYATRNLVSSNDELDSTVSSNTFPRILSDILNLLFTAFNAEEYHVMSDSSMISFHTIGVNILIFLMIFIVAFLVSKGKIAWAMAYILLEVVYWSLRRFAKQGGGC